MENEVQIMNAVKGMAAKIENIEKSLFDLTTLFHNFNQLQKQTMYLISQGKEPFNQAPKGETDTLMCEDCGARIFKQDSMKKSRIINDDVVLFTTCRKCFYGNREKGKIHIQ